MATSIMLDIADHRPAKASPGTLADSALMSGVYARRAPEAGSARPPDARIWNNRELAPWERAVVEAALAGLRQQNLELIRIAARGDAR